MHVIFREAHGLEDTERPCDLGQSPADIVVLSFSDSDLGAFAEGWHLARGALPTLRLANLASLRHPLSVDTYIEATLAHAKAILIRLIGGESYWPYGLAQVQALARARGIALAVLPGDGRADPRLDGLSTLPIDELRQLAKLCDGGGARAACVALHQLAVSARLASSHMAAEGILPDCGWYDPRHGVIAEPPRDTAPVVVTFYRSYLAAADMAAVDALIARFRAKGMATIGLFVPSLKVPASAQWVRAALGRIAPAAIVSVTAFSARGDDGSSPLDEAGCPVFQVALSTARRREWNASLRGLSPADLAMHVALPEVDGRIFAGVASFKAIAARDPDLQFSRATHCPDRTRIDAIVDRVVAWHRLARTPADERRLALVLSTYPGRADQMAHAVGLDTIASVEGMLTSLKDEGYRVVAGDNLAVALQHESVSWPIEAYRSAFARLPRALQEAAKAAWDEPDCDPALHDGAFHFTVVRRGAALIALQPERAADEGRESSYHDVSVVPRHGYIAFYLWLRAQDLHALVHVGAHGTLEWLPGKSVALSRRCWPEALIGDLPVIYPFIVNNPGEAAQAKRRLGAVTLGHLPPRPRMSGLPPALVRLEHLLDEYSTADGLDPKRRWRLIESIREEAQSAGIERDLALSADASAADAITRIDRFVCDIKESQFGDGLHIYGEVEGETQGLIAALSGRRVNAGPAGSPWAGRQDVLPTGRNLYAVDPRAVPSRAAYAQGVTQAQEVLRRHLQDHGDWPRNLMIDVWGSATMRTAGVEFSMALHMAGLAPRWDEASQRVCGFEILPLAMLGRPRIDVALRMSGLFRDVFSNLAQLFAVATLALAARTEEGDDNPYTRQAARVFGPEPGRYGINARPRIDLDGSDNSDDVAEAWLAASQWAFDAMGSAAQDRPALEQWLRDADGLVHIQDLPETDLLLAADYAVQQGGFAAAAARVSENRPALYHLDATRSGTLRARTVMEEIARIVRARAANPAWADGMTRHGFRGAAELAATLDHLAAFAQLTRAVPSHLIDLYHDATLGRDEIVAFMADENPAALEALRVRFLALRAAGLWSTRRNSIAAELEDSHV